MFGVTSQFYKLPCIKAVAEVFVMEDVAHLVGDDLCVADYGVDVGVGVAVDPYTNAEMLHLNDKIIDNTFFYDVVYKYNL